MNNEFAWTFQGGRHRTITIGATAGNVATNLTPTLGKRWLILRARITLVCDATVASRVLVVGLTDGTNQTQAYPYFGATATQTIRMWMSELNFNLNALAASAFDCYLGINPILLEGADQFTINVYSGVAGDSYSGFVDILEIDV